MIADLDTLLTALHAGLTDRIIPSVGLARAGPGRPPEAALRWLADHTPGSAEMLRLRDATPIPGG